MDKNENRTGKADLHDQNNMMPEDVLNKAQDPDSFHDPLEVQKAKEEKMTKVSGPIDDKDPGFRPKDR